MKNFKTWHKVLVGIGIAFCFGLFLQLIGFEADKDKPKENNIFDNSKNENVEIDENSKNDELSISDDQKDMIIATSQIALKRHSFDDDTSGSKDNWTINVMNYDKTKRWTAVTNSNSLGRTKFIFDWSGDNNDDLVLVYLLVNGEEIINDLRK